MLSIREHQGGCIVEVELIEHQGWAEVILNRPQRGNAINGPLGERLATTFEHLNAIDRVQAVLLRGASGAFCSGLDAEEFNAEPAPDWLLRFNDIWRGAHKALYQCRKPIVVALERYAVNGGASFALAADLLVVGKRAFLQVGEVTTGMTAPYSMAWLRLRHSESVAAQIALTGRRFSGEELSQLGIAYAVAEDGEVLQRASELAVELASYPPGAAERMKATLRAYNDAPADAWFDRTLAFATGPRQVLLNPVK